jgi:2-iminobutanoate/2-iminopropanoate deaminase
MYLAGQVARDAAGEPLGGDDVVAQFHHAMQNLVEVLKAANSTLQDLVKMTMWIVQMDRVREIQDARRTYFDEWVPPSSSLGVTRLADPRHLIEIEAVAILG